MKLETVVVGMLEENCYILKNGNQAILIDPGDEPEKIKKQLGNSELLASLITHRHFDHIGALNSFSAPIYEKEMLKEQDYQIGPFQFTVLFTPGHTADSVSYYFKEENSCFTGDFLFAGTVGRTDLPTGNMEEMRNSIERIKQYPDSTKIFPGHGTSTTLKQEKQENPYFGRHSLTYVKYNG